MKIIIVGAGEAGYHIARKLPEEDQDAILIDKDPAKVKRLTENPDIQAILGSMASPRMLRDSGVDEAELLVAARDSDEVNLIACLLARHLNPYILKVARGRSADNFEEKDLLAQNLLAMDHIINPESVMVDAVLNLMMAPGASDVIDFVDGRVKLFGVTIGPDSPFVGRCLLSSKGLEGKFLPGPSSETERLLFRGATAGSDRKTV